LTGLNNGNITLKENKDDPMVRLYKSGLGNFKDPKPLMMTAPKD
jgi:hypothetical protein